MTATADFQPIRRSLLAHRTLNAALRLREPRARRGRGPLPWLAVAACLACAAPAFAERADRDKPVNIEADSMTYDDLKQLNVFTGNVTLTKGTIVIHANRLVLRQDPAGYQYATAIGNPATFRQKRDGVDQFIAGSAQQLDYDGKTETVKLQEKANLKRLERARVTDEVHGNLIVYDSRTEFFNVESGGPAAATPENPSGRVRVIIQPKNGGASAPAATQLTPAQTLETPRK
jgi:lipopolysaccharide export system protein LptA